MIEWPSSADDTQKVHVMLKRSIWRSPLSLESAAVVSGPWMRQIDAVKFHTPLEASLAGVIAGVLDLQLFVSG